MTTATDLLNALKATTATHYFHQSHKNNSHYWTINGSYYRVADHGKPYESKYVEGVNDFRDYDEFINHLTGGNNDLPIAEAIAKKMAGDKQKELDSRIIGEWYYNEKGDYFEQWNG